MADQPKPTPSVVIPPVNTPSDHTKPVVPPVAQPDAKPMDAAGPKKL